MVAGTKFWALFSSVRKKLSAQLEQEGWCNDNGLWRDQTGQTRGEHLGCASTQACQWENECHPIAIYSPDSREVGNCLLMANWSENAFSLQARQLVMVPSDISAWLNQAALLPCWYLPVGSERHAEILRYPRHQKGIFASEHGFKEQKSCVWMSFRRDQEWPHSLGGIWCEWEMCWKGFFSELGVLLAPAYCHSFLPSAKPSHTSQPCQSSGSHVYSWREVILCCFLDKLWLCICCKCR